MRCARGAAPQPKAQEFETKTDVINAATEGAAMIYHKCGTNVIPLPPPSRRQEVREMNARYYNTRNRPCATIKMKPRFNGLILTLSLQLGLLLITMVVSCSKRPTFSSFASEGTNYYARLAVACDSLILKVGSNTNKLDINGNDTSLPPMIRDLHPTIVRVMSGIDKNGNPLRGVSIMSGASRNGWGIAWEQQDFDYATNPVPWTLSVNTEDDHKILFSTNKPPRIKSAGKNYGN
jgi:hypothetical protein